MQKPVVENSYCWSDRSSMPTSLNSCSTKYSWSYIGDTIFFNVRLRTKLTMELALSSADNDSKKINRTRVLRVKCMNYLAKMENKSSITLNDVDKLWKWQFS